MHFILDRLRTVYIEVHPQQQDKFVNFNSQNDLDHQ